MGHSRHPTSQENQQNLVREKFNEVKNQNLVTQSHNVSCCLHIVIGMYQKNKTKRMKMVQFQINHSRALFLIKSRVNDQNSETAPKPKNKIK